MDGDEETAAATVEYPEPETDGGAPGALREEGMGARNERFDPTPYMRQLRGRGSGGEYLDVKWRLLWLRKEHPDAEIVTEHVQIEPTLAIFKATVTLPSGGKATGYGSETAGDFGDFIEKAETKAIGRALNALGYGAQFGERGDEDPAAPPARVAPRPAVEPPRLSERTARPPAGSTPAAERPALVSAPVVAAPRPVADAGRPGPPPAAVDPDPDPNPTRRAEVDGEGGERPAPPIDLADYSWTAFWPWARGLGLNGPQAIEGLIGRATAGLSPAQLRELIVQARGEG